MKTVQNAHMFAAAIPDGFLPLDLLQHLFFHASAVVADGDPKFLLFFSHNHKNLDFVLFSTKFWIIRGGIRSSMISSSTS